MKVALVYDWLTTSHGGAEHVLRALHELFPDAPLYTSLYDQESVPWARDWDIRPSFLQHIPFAKKHFRFFGLLMPLAFESFDFSEYDVVISVTSSFAKSSITQPWQHHLCYLLTPNRHLYSHEQAYQRQIPFPFRSIWKLVLKYLQSQDQVAAARPDLIVPISHLVAQRTHRYYHRITAPVIYPPVPIHPQPLQRHSPDGYYLVVSRLVAYKQIDLAIQACQQLGRKLVIVGSGPELRRLRRLADHSFSQAHVEFVPKASRAKLESLFAEARGLLMPGLEDFGITAVEAVSRGVPVILHQDSGAAELLRPLKEAVFLPKSTLAELIKAMHTLEVTTWDPVIMNKQVAKYSKEHFQEKFRSYVKGVMV